MRIYDFLLLMPRPQIISFLSKKEIPFSINFILRNRSTGQYVDICFDNMSSIQLTEVDDLCEALKGAKGTISDLMEAIEEYFPGVLQEECLNGI